jgi:hypothetical protein
MTLVVVFSYAGAMGIWNVYLYSRAPASDSEVYTST